MSNVHLCLYVCKFTHCVNLFNYLCESECVEVCVGGVWMYAYSMWARILMQTMCSDKTSRWGGIVWMDLRVFVWVCKICEQCTVPGMKERTWRRRKAPAVISWYFSCNFFLSFVPPVHPPSCTCSLWFTVGAAGSSQAPDLLTHLLPICSSASLQYPGHCQIFQSAYSVEPWPCISQWGTLVPSRNVFSSAPENPATPLRDLLCHLHTHLQPREEKSPFLFKTSNLHLCSPTPLAVSNPNYQSDL